MGWLAFPILIIWWFLAELSEVGWKEIWRVIKTGDTPRKARKRAEKTIAEADARREIEKRKAIKEHRERMEIERRLNDFLKKRQAEERKELEMAYEAWLLANKEE